MKTLNEQLSRDRACQENSLSKEKEKLELLISKMEAKIVCQQSNTSALQVQQEKIKEEAKCLQEQVDNLLSELRDKEGEIKTLKGELKVHEQPTVSMESEDRRHEVIRKLEDQARQQEEELASITKELEDTKFQEGILRTKCSQMETRLFQHSEECSTPLAQVDLDGKLQLSEAMAVQSETSTQYSNQLDIENVSLKAAIVTLEKKVQDMEEDGESKHQSFQTILQENAKCSKQLAKLKDHLIEVHMHVV